MDDVPGRRAEATVPRGGIPLVLAPLLSPYRKHGQLSVRVERLPNGARLSKGSNNGDRTWSLRVDELDDVTYLPPESLDEAHTLAIRILSLDGDHGATLALLDLPVSPGAPPLVASPPAEPAAAPVAATVPDDGELRRLRDHLAEVGASLAARETELAALRQMLEQARAGAAAEAASTLANSRAAWQDDERHRIVDLEKRAEERIEQARQHFQQEARAALAAAEAAWKAGEAARIAEAEARIRAESQRALAETEARAQRAEAALAQARPDDQLARERQRWQQEAQAALAAAEAAWKAGEAARIAEAEARIRAESQRALAEAEARAQQAEAALAQARPDDQLARERQRWQQEADVTLATAEAAWKAGEARRIADAEARGRAESMRAVTEAKAQAARAEQALAQVRAQGEGDAMEIHVLRDEAKQLKAALARRDSGFGEARPVQHAGAASISLANQLLAVQSDEQSDATLAEAASTTAPATAEQAPRRGRRLFRLAFLLVVAGMAVMFYPRYEPVLLDLWRSYIQPHMGAAEPVLAKIKALIRR